MTPTRIHRRGSGPVRRRMNSVRRLTAKASALLAAAMLALVMTAIPAWAHATLTSSSPSNGAVVPTLPSAVVLTFDEPVRPVAGAIKVLNPDGQSVGGAVTADGPKVVIALPRMNVQGTYTLTWRVIAADSHPVGGAVNFSLGHPSRADDGDKKLARTSMAVSVLFTIMRFAGYAGFALLAGAVAFCCYGLPRALELRGVRSLILSGWATLTAGTLGALLLEGPYGVGAGLGALLRPELLRQTLALTSGKALIARLVFLGLLPFLLAYALPRLKAASRTGRIAYGGIPAVAMVAIAATWSVGGHAVSSTQPVVTVSLDIVHLCAMALWLGGLATVTITVRAWRAEPDMAAGVDRFSTVAVCAVAALAGTGLYQAWLWLRTPAALFGTPYGTALTVKAVLVGLVLSVAFFSRRTLRRRTADLVPDRLTRLVMVETAGLAAALLVASLLVATEPGVKALAAEPVTLTGRYDIGGKSGSMRLRLPSRARGLSNATVSIRDAAGHLRDVPELAVRWSLPERKIGPITAHVHHDAPGRYMAVTAPITVTGQWRIAITIRTSDIDESTLEMSQTIR